MDIGFSSRSYPWKEALRPQQQSSVGEGGIPLITDTRQRYTQHPRRRRLHNTTSRPRQDSGCNVGQAPYVRRPRQSSLQVGTLSRTSGRCATFTLQSLKTWRSLSPAHSFGHSRLDYANSVKYGMSSSNVARLQRAQNAACSPSSRLGFQGAINKFVWSSETVTLAADRVSHHRLHHLQVTQDSIAIAKKTARCAQYMGALKSFQSPHYAPGYFSRNL